PCSAVLLKDQHEGYISWSQFERNQQVIAQSAHAVLLLRPAAAEGVSDAEHDEFSDGDAFDKQEGAIGAEDPQRAFDLAPPVKRQFAGDDFDELKICVRSRREEGRVPPPSRDDNSESSDKR